MPKQINWGIIGLGKIANLFAQDLLLAKDAVLYAVASRDPQKAKSFAEKYHATKYYTGYEDLILDPNVDIVYVATPHVFHFPNTMLCLQHGKAVLCEKPFGMNTGEVQTMIQEARTRKLFLMEALWTRFIPATLKVLDLLKQDTIGEIEYLRADFGFLADPDPEKRVFNKALGGGSLMDIGIYPIFLSLLTMGVPSTIKAMASFTTTGVDHFCAMLFDFPKGQKAILESTTLAGSPIEAIIYGTKGSIKMHRRFHHTERLTISRNGFADETIDIPLTGNGYYHEILEVMECMNNNQTESNKMSHAFSLDLIRILDRVRQEIGLSYD